MIKIDVLKEKEVISKIVLKGHALYDDYGKDIVCSGVSSVVITTVNAILLFDKKYITYESVQDKFEIIINEHNEIVDKLIQNMLNMLKDIENDYPKNIKIRKENL